MLYCIRILDWAVILMQIGLTHSVSESVTAENTADKVGSGLLPVYATPAMLALMEKCAADCVAPYLEEGKTTVGTKADIEHLSASPLGMQITCKATLSEIDNRRLVFAVEAFDDKGLIGKGTHERFIIDVERFMQKCKAKLD